MTTENVIIDQALLASWDACAAGKRVYKQLFPDGATLSDAIAGLDAAGHGFGTPKHDDWSLWLFNAFRTANPGSALVALGYRNSGYQNSGDRNSGDQNSGNWNSGDRNSGDQNSGNWNSGDRNSGYRNSGYQNSGDRNSGDRNSGDQNSGDRNSGDQNSGNWNSGDRNSGDQNSGDQNSGDRNSGDQNSGNWNSGDQNSGDQNSGNWNSGCFNSGCFNTNAPPTVRVFGVEVAREVWDAAYKPAFLRFSLTSWIDETDMTDADKVADPHFHIRGGQLRTKPYKQAFQDSWNAADPTDRERIRDLPGFDAQMFFEISGIDLR